MNVRAERFPLMDSVRALGALTVLGGHAALVTGIYTSGSPVRSYLTQLDVAVTLFFLISAFLLYRPFVQARFNGDPMPDVRVFGWRRFLRIAPGYWLALTLVTIWLGLDTVVNPTWHVALFYGFGQIYTPGTAVAGIGQAWTLCVEATFYVFLPIWAYATRGLGWRAELAALGALAAVSIAWKAFALQHVKVSDFGGIHYGGGPWLQPLPNFLDQIALGMALAVVSVRGVPARFAGAFTRAWPWWLGAGFLYWLLVQTVGTPRVTIGTAAFIGRHELRGVIAAAILVPVIFAWQRGGAIRRVLAWPPLLYVGVISYGVYLWNNAMVGKLASLLNGRLSESLGFGATMRWITISLLAAAAAIAISSLSYHLVERPVLGLRRLVRPRRGHVRPGEALAEPAPAAPVRPQRAG